MTASNKSIDAGCASRLAAWLHLPMHDPNQSPPSMPPPLRPEPDAPAVSDPLLPGEGVPQTDPDRPAPVPLQRAPATGVFATASTAATCWAG